MLNTPVLYPRVLLLVVVAAAVLAGLWAVEWFLLRTAVLTGFRGLPPLRPLYAFFEPGVVATAVAFPIAAALLIVAVPRLIDTARVPGHFFSVVLLLAAMVLPLSLFAVRTSPAELGGLLLMYPGEEIIYDAANVHAMEDLSLGGFYANYIELMPHLSLHGQHFPPGLATLYYLMQAAFGPNVLAAAIMVLLFFAGGVWCAYRMFLLLTPARGARIGALLLLACPSVLDFACTANDAVFFAVASLACCLCVWALAERSHWLVPIGAGLAMFCAAMISFSVAPLGLLVLLFAAAHLCHAPAEVGARLAVMAVVFLAAAFALHLVTGFNLWACFNVARAQNTAFMTAVIGQSPWSLYPQVAYGNLVAFLIGLGMAPLTAVALRYTTGRPRFFAFDIAALLTLAVMALAGIYTLETERIWLFAAPWVIAIAVAGRPLSPIVVRTLLAVGLAQAAVMEALLFTLW